jgi:hypothetical protein
MKPAARVTESARHRSGSGVPPPSAPARTTLTLIAITSGIRHPASGIRHPASLPHRTLARHASRSGPQTRNVRPVWTDDHLTAERIAGKQDPPDRYRTSTLRSISCRRCPYRTSQVARRPTTATTPPGSAPSIPGGEGSPEGRPRVTRRGRRAATRAWLLSEKDRYRDTVGDARHWARAGKPHSPRCRRHHDCVERGRVWCDAFRVVPSPPWTAAPCSARAAQSGPGGRRDRRRSVAVVWCAPACRTSAPV